ncbi:MAG TPA: hypothetical protein VL463_18985 [Kofleriaceae bacterium]|nr:hypothetical protein [Kofleriaceae bacterium]
MAGSADAAAADVVAGEKLEIGLEHTRWRHFGWTVFGIIGGALLILKMGTVAQWIGAGLIVAGLWSAYNFTRTLLFEAGTIVVDGKRVVLPRGVCRGKPVELDRAAVAHAYLLRRAVPWTRAAPVLVIEAGDRAYLFPRDWFATEADQRRVIHALAQVKYGEAHVDQPAMPKPPRIPRL